MRARLARPRRIVRGRLVAPVAAAAAVALVGGVVVATPDAPTVRGDVQTVAVSAPAFNAGASYSFDLQGLVGAGEWSGIVITEVTGLPEGLTYADGVISGTAAAAGVYTVTVVGTLGGQAVSIPVTLTVNNPDGTAPIGAEAGPAAAVEGSLGGEAQAGGQITTGSAGTDAILGAVVSIVTSLGGESAGEMVTGSLGTGGTTPDAPGQTPAAPLGSDANGQLDLGSLAGGTPGDDTTPDAGSPLGSAGNAGGQAGGEVTGGIDTESLGPLGSLLDTGGQTGSTTEGETTTGGDLTVGGGLNTVGQVEVPGSSSPVDSGSLGALAPGLAFTGIALLGLAGLGLALGGGSSAPGTSSLLPALPGTSTGGSSNGGGSAGSTVPTVAAGAPSTVQAPGPTVANGRG
ncbi:hypothetical protein H483_0113745 [Dietzia sp. UCD-THP]|uniref:hypothetical protein n=1 Tax=Dietzia sp. UCD-THP TaxID=1292020 RepID=UPI00037929B8|nr:hypothetical protein [Dietzia sp. UCD-THP]EYT59895.1 hypothetical protein H483_0113745 [Dietzia sp. UCD-THP]